MSAKITCVAAEDKHVGDVTCVVFCMNHLFSSASDGKIKVLSICCKVVPLKITVHTFTLDLESGFKIGKRNCCS